jgi:hypothetical protein
MYNGKPLSWLPVVFTSALGCVHGPTGAAGAAEAWRLLMDMVAVFKGSYNTGTTLLPVYKSGPNSHLVVAAIGAAIKVTCDRPSGC